jgi:hypothetical protein
MRRVAGLRLMLTVRLSPTFRPVSMRKELLTSTSPGLLYQCPLSIWYPSQEESVV